MLIVAPCDAAEKSFLCENRMKKQHCLAKLCRFMCFSRDRQWRNQKAKLNSSFNKTLVTSMNNIQ